jgi:hypothetical protein
MLSKVELEFLKSPESFNADYSRVLRHRIKAKTAQLRSELALLKGTGVSVTENCNGITEFSNGKTSLNQAYFDKKAPRKGFEPLRTSRSTGSQGPRVNHSATSARMFHLCYCVES